MAIEPKNTREHIISLYGHITGLKKDINQIKNNHLKHIHEDVEKLGGKIDKVYWVLLAAAGTAVLFVLEKFISHWTNNYRRDIFRSNGKNVQKKSTKN